MEKINTKPNTKVSVVVQKISSSSADSGSLVIDSNDTFSVAVSRFCKVRKLHRKIKKLLGVRMVDQALLLVPSQRQLLPSETIESLLPSTDQKDLKLYLLVSKNCNTKVGEDKLCPRKERKSFQPKESPAAAAAAAAAAPASMSATQSIVEPTEAVAHKEEEEESAQSPLVSTTSTIIKLSFQDVHRRVSFEHQPEEASFAKLAELCTRFFGIKNAHRMLLSYRDEDGDDVQLSTDAELAYALAHYAETSPAAHPQTPLLRLAFAVKPAGLFNKNAPAWTAEATAAPQSEDSTEERVAETIPSSTPSSAFDSNDASAGVRTLKHGAVIVLQQTRPNGVFNLTFSHKEQRIVAARQQKNDNTDDVGIRKNAQWIVEKVDAKNDPEDESEDQQEVFLLSCKSLAEKAAKEENPRRPNLRVLPSGRVDHSGGRGAWARFAVVVAKQPNDVVPRVSLRCVGRSLRQKEDNFLGLVFNDKKKELFVVGNLKDASKDDAKFEMKFVSSP